MYCPSCGAPNNAANQRYCQECGTTLPTTGGPATALVDRPAGDNLTVRTAAGRGAGLINLLPPEFRNKLLLGAGGAVLAVIVLYIVVNAIVSIFMHLVLPIALVLAVIYVGYRFLRSKN